MGDWLKQNAVALVLACVGFTGSFTAGQVLTEKRLSSIEARLSEAELKGKKYIPIVEKLEDDVLVLKRDYSELYKITYSTALISQENSTNIKILLESKGIINEMRNEMTNLTGEVRVVKNDVSHIRDKLNKK